MERKVEVGKGFGSWFSKMSWSIITHRLDSENVSNVPIRYRQRKRYVLCYQNKVVSFAAAI
jgi:hypothetical protein